MHRSVCPSALLLRLRRQRGSAASSLTGARSPRLRRRRGHSLTCPLPLAPAPRGATMSVLSSIHARQVLQHCNHLLLTLGRVAWYRGAASLEAICPTLGWDRHDLAGLANM